MSPACIFINRLPSGTQTFDVVNCSTLIHFQTVTNVAWLLLIHYIEYSSLLIFTRIKAIKTTVGICDSICETVLYTNIDLRDYEINFTVKCI